MACQAVEHIGRNHAGAPGVGHDMGHERAPWPDRVGHSFTLAEKRGAGSARPPPGRPLGNTLAIRKRFAIMIALARSEEHTSELQSLMRISYAVFCLKKKKQ